MPLYEYISADPDGGCRTCSRGFELRRPVDRPALEVCPVCKRAIKKLVGKVNTPKITKPLSVSDAKKAGFTILEKRCDGNYEKL